MFTSLFTKTPRNVEIPDFKITHSAHQWLTPNAHRALLIYYRRHLREGNSPWTLSNDAVKTHLNKDGRCLTWPSILWNSAVCFACTRHPSEAPERSSSGGIWELCRIRSPRLRAAGRQTKLTRHHDRLPSRNHLPTIQKIVHMPRVIGRKRSLVTHFCRHFPLLPVKGG